MLFKPPLSLMARNILISSLHKLTAGLHSFIPNIMFEHKYIFPFVGIFPVVFM